MLDIKGTLQVKRVFPLHCWDLYAMERARINVNLKEGSDWCHLLKMQARHQWQTDLTFVQMAAYDALVLTDVHQRIEWVSTGFHSMTGYQPKEVIGKSPKLLQGERTTTSSLQSLMSQLLTKKPFHQEIVNYRKNGESYICRLEVYPLYNHQQKINHFLALEREVYEH